MQILKLIYILLVLAPLSTLGQATFFNVYSSGHFDIGEGICQLADSSYLVTGSSGGFNATSPQAFVMKVSKKGKQIWTVNKGGEEAETGRRIFYINDTIYLFGRTNSFGNSYDYYFLKLDSLGNTIDEKTIGTPDFEWLQDVVFLPKDSSFILYGYWQENDGFTKKRQLIKIDRAGTVLWQKEYPMHLEAQLKSMHTINDSVFGITGNEYNTSSGHFDGLFYSFTNQGTIIDSLLLPAQPGRDMFFNDFAKHTNSYYIIGNSELHENGEVYSDLKTVYYEPDVNDVRVTGVGIGDYFKTKSEFIVKKKFAPYNYYMIERASQGSFSTYSDGMKDEQISLFFGFDTLFWSKTVANVSRQGDDITNQAIQTLDGGMITVGYNEYFANNAQNVFLLKIGGNDESPGFDSHPGEEPLLGTLSTNKANRVSVYPNPVNEKLMIVAEGDFRAKIYDATGSFILESSKDTINVSTLPSGMYVLKIVSNNSSSTFKFIKN